LSNNRVYQDGIFKKGYGSVAKLVMTDKKLDIEAKAIYAYLCSFAGAGMTAFPGAKKIINDLNISENRFYKYRKQLIKNGYIKIIKNRKNGKRDNNLYKIINNPKQHLQNKGVEIQHL